MNFNILSESMLLSIKRGEEFAPYIEALRLASWGDLLNSIKTEDEKKAFWLNLYNSFIQLEVSANPNVLEKRGNFFTKKAIQIGEKRLSFDDIEHGILRRGAFKFGAGFIRNPLMLARFKEQMLKQHDFRIHFALNCGASSCPSIMAYKPAKISEQLHKATRGFLEEESFYSQKENTVVVSRLMLWFYGDFGGHKGIRRILKHYNIIPLDKNPKIDFSPYNWEPHIGKYQ
jgi:hypothetical protein